MFQKEQCGVYDDNGITRWINNGMLVWHAGLVKDGDDYRYFKRNGMVTGVETYVAKTNGLLKAAKYTFDAEGRLMKLEGLHEDLNGNLCYYVDYVKNYAGLVEVDGSFYYIASDLKAVKNCTYYVTKTNDLKPAGYYTFDADGKMVIKNGLVEENGDLYYYVDGAKTAAGLIKWEGNYYYIASNLKAVKNAKHYVFADKANGLKSAGWYWFNADGTMYLEGIREENGTKYYYKDGVKNYAGLIEISGDYYYVKSDCSVVCNRSYYVTKSNGLMPSATYTFGADGKMVIKNGIYREKLGDGNEYLFYYVNNVRQVGTGLVQLDDGSYIYVRSGANLAVGSYSCHPRSRKRLEATGFQLDTRVIAHEPLGFLDYNCLQTNAFAVVSDSGTLPEESSFFLSVGKPFPAVSIRTSTERPEALDAGCFVLSGIYTEQLLQSIDMAVGMQRNGDFGTPVTDYTAENVSMKVARIIQSYTGIVNHFVWRKL